MTNTRRGWLRIWVVVSVIWLIPCFIAGGVMVVDAIENSSLPSGDGVLILVALMAVPLALYGLGETVAWIHRGFKDKSASN